MKNLVNYFPLKVYIKVNRFGAETLMEFLMVGRVICVNVGENRKEANFDSAEENFLTKSRKMRKKRLKMTVQVWAGILPTM